MLFSLCKRIFCYLSRSSSREIMNAVTRAYVGQMGLKWTALAPTRGGELMKRSAHTTSFGNFGVGWEESLLGVLVFRCCGYIDRNKSEDEPEVVVLTYMDSEIEGIS